MFHFKFSKFCLFILLSTFYFLLSINLADAAELKVLSPTQEIGVGRQFQVDILLDAEGESINAVEGRIVFPSNLLEFKEINDGDSIVSLWVEKPSLNSKFYPLNSVFFSGIIPGGFEGVLSPYWSGLRPGKVFSLVFEAQGAGEGMIEIRDAQALLNNEHGTPAELIIKNYEVRIKDKISDSLFVIPDSDGEPPEEFKIEIIKDSNVFDGQWFLAFAARDKGSGIDHYELQENRKQAIETKRWMEAESPYLLKDQNLQSYIYIRVVDKAGNERIEMAEPRYPYTRLWHEKSWVWAIIGGIMMMGIIFLVYKRRRIKN